MKSSTPSFLLTNLLSFVSVSSVGAFLPQNPPRFVLERKRLEESPFTWIDNIIPAEDGVIEDRRLHQALSLSMSIPMSMSMSLGYHSDHTIHPISTTPSAVPLPATVKNPPQYPLSSSTPSTPPPSVFLPPSPAPSQIPSPPPSPSTDHTIPPFPSLSNPKPTVAGLYECTSGGGIGLVSGTAAEITTRINLSVAYAADVSDNTLTTNVLKDIETTLLEAAVAAALGCDTNNTRRLLMNEPIQRRRLVASTDLLGSCESTVNGSCHILETEMSFLLNDAIALKFATYKSYMALKDGMQDASFATQIERVEKITYLAPLPLVIPMNNATQPLLTQPKIVPSADGEDVQENKTKGWTVGLSVAMSVGGLLVLAAWYQTRRTRNKRHVELVEEDRSYYNPMSMLYAEKELFDDVDLA